jgi:hypothetical protein
MHVATEKTIKIDGHCKIPRDVSGASVCRCVSGDSPAWDLSESFIIILAF